MRKSFRWILLGSATLIALLVLVPWFLPKSFYLDRVTSWVESRYPVELEIGDAHLRLLPRVAVRLEQVRLTMQGEATPLFASERLTIESAWRDLLLRRPVFGIFAKKVEARLIETSRNHFNYDPLLKQTRLSPEEKMEFIREAWAATQKSSASVRSLELQEASIYRKPYGEKEQKIYLSNLKVSPKHFSPEKKSFDWDVDGRVNDLNMSGDGSAEISKQLKLSSSNLSLSVPNLLAMKREKVSFVSDYAKSEDRIEIKNGLLKVGPQAFSVNGSQAKGGRLDLALASDHLDLNYLGKIIPALQRMAEIKNAGLQARYVSERTGATPVISGNVKAAQVSLPDKEFQNLTSSFVYRDRILQVNDLRAGLMGGTASGSAKIAMDPKNPGYDFDLNFKNIAMDQVNSVAQLIWGRGDLDVQGRVQGFDQESFKRSLQGNGRLSVREVKIPKLQMFETLAESPVWNVLKRIPGGLDERGLAALKMLDSRINDFASAFRVVNGVIQVPQTTLKFPSAAAALKGGIGLDKSLDFSGDLSLERELLSRIIKNPDLLAALTRSGPLVVPIQIKGSIKAPMVMPDMKVVQSRLLAAAGQKAEETVRERIKKTIEKKQLPQKQDLPTRQQIEEYIKKL